MIKDIGNMTTDEAINYCIEVIKNKNESAQDINQCAQLYTWLQELKDLREFKKKIIEAVKS